MMICTDYSRALSTGSINIGIKTTSKETAECSKMAARRGDKISKSGGDAGNLI